MRRRDILSLFAGSVVFGPFSAHGQQDLPVVAFFRSTSAAPFAHVVSAFQQGLREGGLVDGRDASIEYHWAGNDLARVSAMAEDLVQRNVAVIIGNSVAIEAVRKLTSTIPIVFVVADDPVKTGLVVSLNRPEGNLTGVTFFAGGQLGAKRLELLLELVPTAEVVAVLLDPNYPGSRTELPSIEAAVRKLGRRAVVVRAVNDNEFPAAFADMKQAKADILLVIGSPVFTGKRRKLVEAAAENRIPAIYDQRDHVLAGGLISYGASFTDAYRQAGVYASRIVEGATPAELPVLQPTAFELAVNLKTAALLGLDVPPSILVRANEIIE